MDRAPAGGTDYAEYLLIDDLLDLQRPLTPGAHDELLFIVVHQSYELWFKLILHTLTEVVAALGEGRSHAAVPGLRRVLAIERLLLEHLNVLETMGPERFMEFRDPLAPASGFQSRQFREIETVSGGALWEAFLGAGRSLGLHLPADDEDARVGSLAELYRDHAEPERAALHQVAELLVDHDETIARWRHHHTLMAAREIGTRPGTGGSHGVQYLQSTLGKRFFADLWAVRGVL